MPFALSPCVNKEDKKHKISNTTSESSLCSFILTRAVLIAGISENIYPDNSKCLGARFA